MLPKILKKWSFICAILAVVILALQRLVFWLLHPLFASADTSVYLQIGELILQGKVPYRDFYDFNPPMIMYLNVVPVLVAHLFHLPVPMGLTLTVQTIIFIATAFVGWLMYRYAAYLPATVFLPVLLAFVYFSNNVDSDMGQREHLLTLFYFPYFILRGIRHFGASPGRIESILCGLLTGTLLSLKPHFFFLAICAELGFLAESKNLKSLLAPEVKSVFVVPVLYVMLYFCLPQEAISIFWEQIFPVYQYGVGWAAKTFTHMVSGYFYFAIPFLELTLALALAFYLRPLSPWVTPFVFICLASMLNYIQGAQAWTYRLLPMALFVELLLALEFGILANIALQFLLKYWQGFRPIAATVLLGLVGNYSYGRLEAYYHEVDTQIPFDLAPLGFHGKNPRGDFEATFFSMLENSSLGDKVVHIGTGIHPGFPCQLQACRPPGSRYLYFMTTMIVASIAQKPELKEKYKLIEKTVVQNLGEDILKNRPTLVYIQDDPVMSELEQFNFKERYLKLYSLFGHVDATAIYKLTGSKYDFHAVEPSKRVKIILPILTGQKTIEEISKESKVPELVLKDWVQRANKAMINKLTDRSSDLEDELKQEINHLNDTLWAKNQELGKLNEQLYKLEKAKENGGKPEKKPEEPKK